jgi:hypothetical protein
MRRGKYRADEITTFTVDELVAAKRITGAQGTPSNAVNAADRLNCLRFSTRQKKRRQACFLFAGSGQVDSSPAISDHLQKYVMGAEVGLYGRLP